jgi:NAD-dependent deacetylase
MDSNLSPNEKRRIERVVDVLLRAESLLVITGAGLSADSGLPTYWGVGGLYEEQSFDEGHEIQEILSTPMLHTRPELTWKHLLRIGRAVAQAKPNRGHEILAEMEHHFSRFWILTQNVDGFHTQAGAENVLEIHGNMHHLGCTSCRWRRRTFETLDESPTPPKCPDCGELIRPEVILFGDLLPTDVLDTLQRELERGFDLVMSIGTSSNFPYIALPVQLIAQQGGATVEINPGTTMISDLVDQKISLRSAEALEAIWEAYRSRRADEGEDL